MKAQCTPGRQGLSILAGIGPVAEMDRLGRYARTLALIPPLHASTLLNFRPAFSHFSNVAPAVLFNCP
jgi:hypothetical protein